MKKTPLIAAVLVAQAALGDTTDCGRTRCADGAPPFDSYPVQAVSYAAPAPVSIGTPQSKRFRTVLRAGAAAGPNFAGHFTVVTWGCGVACQSIAIVDSTNGRVYFPEALKLNAYQEVWQTPLPAPFQFRLDSRLLVVVGSPNDSDSLGVFYYVWDPPKLRLIYGDPRKWSR
jgi:hypothetical protein